MIPCNWRPGCNRPATFTKVVPFREPILICERCMRTIYPLSRIQIQENYPPCLPDEYVRGLPSVAERGRFIS